MKATINKINAAIQGKYPDIEFVKGNGYFYLSAKTDEAQKLLGEMDGTIVCPGNGLLSQMPLDEWVSAAEGMLSEASKYISDRPTIKSTYGKIKL